MTKEKLIQALYAGALLLILVPALLSRVDNLPPAAVWLPTLLAAALFVAARLLARKK